MTNEQILALRQALEEIASQTDKMDQVSNSMEDHREMSVVAKYTYHIIHANKELTSYLNSKSETS